MRGSCPVVLDDHPDASEAAVDDRKPRHGLEVALDVLQGLVCCGHQHGCGHGLAQERHAALLTVCLGRRLLRLEVGAEVVVAEEGAVPGPRPRDDRLGVLVQLEPEAGVRRESRRPALELEGWWW